MNITRLHVVNYKALRDVEVPMSNFACLIGENNAGKSSMLQALTLFLSGSKLAPHHYFDPGRPIDIDVTFSEIGADDLGRLANEEHQRRINNYVKDRSLTIRRHYDKDGKGELQIVCDVPTDSRFDTENVKALLKNRRPGQATADTVAGQFPELSSKMGPASTIDEIRAFIQALGDELPAEQKHPGTAELPTGFDKTIAAFLPEPLYIPAVKDLADDIKTTESATFGRVLSILFRAIEAKLGDAQEVFQKLHGQLNRVTNADGTTTDNRLDEVKTIETTIEAFLSENFPRVNIEINIPPPRLQTVLSGAQIFVDDGVRGLVETKGDGLKRSVTFAILRAWAELSKVWEQGEDEERRRAPNYILLFEEPELYLHPKAQQLLFEALATFAERHVVCVTTHSPLFFGPQATATFIKLGKTTDPNTSGKPYTVAYPIDLTDMGAKDQFQLICHDNNNAAFFAERVVLVEGDSDFILLPHIAKTLNEEWDSARKPVAVARINGKSSIRRYRDFFSRFGMDVSVIGDLDLVLKDFEQLSVPDGVKEKRAALIRKLDQCIRDEDPEPSGDRVKSAHQSGALRAKWGDVRTLRKAYSGGSAELDDVIAAVDDFFEWEREDARLSVLSDQSNSEVLALKREFLAMLRELNIFILEKGSIEAYYPTDVEGSDKPAKAQCFCRKYATRQAVCDLCDRIPVAGEVAPVPELEVILKGAFSPSGERNGHAVLGSAERAAPTCCSQ